jgi:hypothetical protein
MEKAFSLEPKEAGFAAALEEEAKQALAAIGALSIEMEKARKHLDSVNEQQRTLVHAALLHRNVVECTNGRMGNGNLYCTLPDPKPEAPAAAPRVNGHAAIVETTAEKPADN